MRIIPAKFGQNPASTLGRRPLKRLLMAYYGKSKSDKTRDFSDLVFVAQT